MILIADSGSTKTDWVALERGEVLVRVSCPGLNPYLRTMEEIEQDIRGSVLPSLQGTVHEVYFYGAGCILDKADLMAGMLRKLFQSSAIRVMTDMLAAAHGLCQRKDGIVCILGTGSNSCLYLGEQIRENVPPLGYILGNEGSAVHIGKSFLADLLRDMLPAGMKEEILTRMHTSYGEIIDQVYKRHEGNALFSELSPVIRSRTDVPEVRTLVRNCFISFIRRNVALYRRKDLSLHFVGSIAYFYEDILSEACFVEGFHLGMVMRSPMEGLIEYYRNQG